MIRPLIRNLAAILFPFLPLLAAMANPIPATERLMLEHGIVDRVMLIYEHSAKELEKKNEINFQGLIRATQIFESGNHIPFEEKEVFPRFREANLHVDLVNSLMEQHREGKELLDSIVRYSNSKSLQSPKERQILIKSLTGFVQMFRPHAAYEETILFSNLRSIIPPEKFEQISDNFEKSENPNPGQNTYNKLVRELSGIEKSMGMDRTARYKARE